MDKGINWRYILAISWVLWMASISPIIGQSGEWAQIEQLHQQGSYCKVLPKIQSFLKANKVGTLEWNKAKLYEGNVQMALENWQAVETIIYSLEKAKNTFYTKQIAHFFFITSNFFS